MTDGDWGIWCARRDCSRRTPLGLRFAPARRRAARVDVQLGRRRPSCRTPLSIVGSSNLKRRILDTRKGFSCTKYNGAPGEIRTPDLLVRSQALYPTELRARVRHQPRQLTSWVSTPRAGVSPLFNPVGFPGLFNLSSPPCIPYPLAEREGWARAAPSSFASLRTAGAAPASPSLFHPVYFLGLLSLSPDPNIRFLLAEREGFEPSMGF